MYSTDWCHWETILFPLMYNPTLTGVMLVGYVSIRRCSTCWCEAAWVGLAAAGPALPASVRMS